MDFLYSYLFVQIIALAMGITSIRLGIDGITKREINYPQQLFSIPNRFLGRDALIMGYFFLFYGIAVIFLLVLLYIAIAG